MSRPNGWTVLSELKMLRSQMLVHSCIYYLLNDNMITDHEWTARAKKLAALQRKIIAKHGHCEVDWFDDAFKDWDGSSGFHLPLRDPWVLRKAHQLLDWRNRDADKERLRAAGKGRSNY